MTTIAKPLLLCLLFLVACRSQEQSYENAYLKLSLPPGWVIAERDNEENSRWLVASINPLDLKNFDDHAGDPTSQNVIVVATNHAGSTTEEFDSYCRGLHSREVDRVGADKVDRFSIVKLRQHRAYYWKSLIDKDGKGPSQQEKYMLFIDPFYISFIFTHSPTGSLAGFWVPVDKSTA